MIWFLATSKSGLGHLRRISTIAREARRLDPATTLGLMTNAQLSGLEEQDRACFGREALAERTEMAASLPTDPGGAIVVDTAVVPGIDSRTEPLALILREMPAERVEAFRLPGGRPWDLVVVPNPSDHWLPDIGPDFTADLAPVGWIYRTPDADDRQADGVPRILVATGGGGKADGADPLRRQIDNLIAALRARVSSPFIVEQALAARAPADARLDGADKVFDPGGMLNACFAAADIVISTAGYNSVLELALTDTPTMLVPIPRSIDDQVARSTLWGPRVGCYLDPDAPEVALDWLRQRVERPARRPRVDLGPSGGQEAARRILALQ